MSAQNTAQTTPNVGSTSAGPARASPSAVLTARFPSQASEQVNQTAQLLSEAAAAKRVAPTTDMAPILVHAAKMNENPYSGLTGTPAEKTAFYKYMTECGNNYWQTLTKVKIEADDIFAGAERTVALVYKVRKYKSYADGLECEINTIVEMKLEEISIGPKIPEKASSPHFFPRHQDGRLVESYGRFEQCDYDMRLAFHAKHYVLQREEFCTDTFLFKYYQTLKNVVLCPDSLWDAYEDLCRALRRIESRGFCQHVEHRSWEGCPHHFTVCSFLPVPGQCYCVKHMHSKKRRRTDKDSDEDLL